MGKPTLTNYIYIYVHMANTSTTRTTNYIFDYAIVDLSGGWTRGPRNTPIMMITIFSAIGHAIVDDSPRVAPATLTWAMPMIAISETMGQRVRLEVSPVPSARLRSDRLGGNIPKSTTGRQARARQ